MLLPKFKQKTGHKAPGKLYLNGRRYNGPFTEDWRGNFYVGDYVKDTRDSQLLELRTEEETTVEFFTKRRVPTEKDYEKSIMTRYFVQDKRSGKVIETDKQYYFAQKKENKAYRSTLTLNWNISNNSGKGATAGSAQSNQISNEVVSVTDSKGNPINVIKGVYQKFTPNNTLGDLNVQLTEKAEKLMPGISKQLLNNPNQFVD